MVLILPNSHLCKLQFCTWWGKPALEHAVKELASIAAPAVTAQVVGAASVGLMEPAGVAVANLLTWVGEMTVRPVVAVTALPDIELEHAKVV